MVGFVLAADLAIAVRSVQTHMFLRRVLTSFLGSAYGYCGDSAGYCDGGCQTAYGTCNAAVNALTAREEPTSAVKSAAIRVGATMTTIIATGLA